MVQANNLLLNVSKINELVVDFERKQEGNYTPLRIDGNLVE